MIGSNPHPRARLHFPTSRDVSGAAIPPAMPLPGGNSEPLETVLLTGATGGIGLALAQALARRGTRVIAGLRDRTREEWFRRSIGSADPGAEEAYAPLADPVVLQADLASLRSVRQFAADVRAITPKLHALVLNAAVVTRARETTVDGFERQFAVNHLAHFLLVQELLPLLRASAPSRVVVVASLAAQGERLDLDDLQAEHDSHGYAPGRAYGRSKLANVMFARGLAHRLAGTGVSVASLHPGVVRTPLLALLRDAAAGEPTPASELLSRARAVAGRVTRMALRQGAPKRWWDTPDEAAARIVHLLDLPISEQDEGQFFVDGCVRESAPQAADDSAVDRLWAISAQLVGTGDP